MQAPKPQEIISIYPKLNMRGNMARRTQGGCSIVLLANMIPARQQQQLPRINGAVQFSPLALPGRFSRAASASLETLGFAVALPLPPASYGIAGKRNDHTY
jgi:hypothetical protein